MAHFQYFYSHLPEIIAAFRLEGITSDSALRGNAVGIEANPSGSGQILVLMTQQIRMQMGGTIIKLSGRKKAESLQEFGRTLSYLLIFQSAEGSIYLGAE
ncbi:MAG: hypothetical protein NDJ90_14845 [Oligoflexia bacterium]|nr:hypothetical protein [Oligoflexia bacterium]